MDARRAVVAFTPLAGALLLPLVVPMLIRKVSLTASLLAAVILASAWFVLMLRTAEMPGHD
jgi:hypothetical protein